LINKICWIEYVVKGQYLEAAGKEFLQSKLPNHLVLNTGSIYGQKDLNNIF